ncbi:MAG: hypothetical protein JW750_09480 [Anaerolineaceae bacterium]|nr:hypothetical protein [Anaerolineaceae bacterium]
MDEPLLRLMVWTPGETILDVSEVEWIRLQLTDGEMGIRPGHTTLLAATVTAPVVYGVNSDEQEIELYGGILKIEKNQVLIFTSGMTSDISGLLHGEIIEEDAKFDRLARELLTRLNVSPRL